MNWQFLMNGVVAGCAHAMVALAVAFVFLPTRFFNFALGAILTSGAYFCYLFLILLGWPMWISIPAAVFSSTLLGTGIDMGVFAAFRRRKASSLVLLLASMGIYVVIQNSISLVFGETSKSLRGAEVQAGILFLGSRISEAQMSIVAVTVLMFATLFLMLRLTRFGRAYRAVSSDPDLALTKGIDSSLIIVVSSAIGSGVVAVAAIAVAFDTDMSPTMGLSSLMGGIVAMIIGGIGSLPGALLGGVFLGLIEHLAIWQIGSQWQDAVAFLVLLMVLIIRPQGLLGKPLSKTSV